MTHIKVTIGRWFLTSSGTTPLVCNACLNLKWSMFGFNPTSHIENKNKDTAFGGRLMPVLKENRDKEPTGPYEERWSKRLCYPRHSDFRGRDMPCLKVREWMVSTLLHHYLNFTELHYTTECSVVWQIRGKINLWSTEYRAMFGRRQRECFLFCTWNASRQKPFLLCCHVTIWHAVSWCNVLHVKLLRSFGLV